MVDYLSSTALNRLSYNFVLISENRIPLLLIEPDELIREFGKRVQILNGYFDNWNIVRISPTRSEYVAFALESWIKTLQLDELQKLCTYFKLELSVKVKFPINKDANGNF